MFETSERVMIEQFQLARQIAKEVAEDLTLLFLRKSTIPVMC